MTENQPLPPELQEMERMLASRLLPEPSAELQRRILAEAQSGRRAELRRDRWQFPAAVAAVVLIGVNLSFGIAQATDFGFRQCMSCESAGPLDSFGFQLGQSASEFPRTQSQRQAVGPRFRGDMLLLPHLTNKE